jgi:colicin import membrane protein
MMAIESTREQIRALLYSIGVHLIAGLLLFSGLLFPRSEPPVVPAGDTLEAVLIDMTLGQPAAKPTPSRPAPPKPQAPKPAPPQPEPKAAEPAPPPVPMQATPDDVTDQRIVPPALPDTTALELERRLEAVRREQERVRAQAAELERQRQQQLEDRRRAQDAERQRQEAQRALDLLNQRAEPLPPGNPRPGVVGGQESLAAQYAALLREVIRQRWRRPPGTPVGIRCVVQVRQIPGGEVLSATIGRPCNADEIVQRSILDAIELASPLPYEGFETVFNPRLELTFEYNGDQ